MAFPSVTSEVESGYSVNHLACEKAEPVEAIRRRTVRIFFIDGSGGKEFKCISAKSQVQNSKKNQG
jgi:hypothetical protein